MLEASASSRQDLLEKGTVFQILEKRLSHNFTGQICLMLIRAQLDFFGAHTYERLDLEGAFHTEWGDA